MRIRFIGFLLVLCSVVLTGCSTIFNDYRSNEHTVSSSLIDFLYPKGTPRTEHTPEIPTLQLPVRVGLAFVPSNNYRGGAAVVNQMALLEKVRKSFLKYDFIDRIEIIPSSYLAAGKGFTTLSQVARIYNVDVMALVSYDQVQRNFENNAALLYWTIVGMYLIPGNDTSVQTFVDTAVFDIHSQKMLFRAPGLSKLEKLSTAVGVAENLLKQSQQGFDLAVTDMVTNLNDELSRFKTRVKEEQVANIEYRNGSGGGGGFNLTSLLLLGLFVSWRVKKTRVMTS